MIVSSGARSAFELRGPYDVVNLATLMGLRGDQAQARTAAAPATVWSPACLPLKALIRSALVQRLRASMPARADLVRWRNQITFLAPSSAYRCCGSASLLHFSCWYRTCALTRCHCQAQAAVSSRCADVVRHGQQRRAGRCGVRIVRHVLPAPAAAAGPAVGPGPPLPGQAGGANAGWQGAACVGAAAAVARAGAEGAGEDAGADPGADDRRAVADGGAESKGHAAPMETDAPGGEPGGRKKRKKARSGGGGGGHAQGGARGRTGLG